MSTFARKRNKMLLNQSAYCKCVLERFRVHFAKLAPTPMADNFDNRRREAASSALRQDYGQRFPYRELMASVLYLSTPT